MVSALEPRVPRASAPIARGAEGLDEFHRMGSSEPRSKQAVSAGLNCHRVHSENFVVGKDGGEGGSQSLLKDKAFSTFLDQNPPFELQPENGISPSTKSLSRPMARRRQQCIKRLASERQIAVAPLSLIGVQAVALTNERRASRAMASGYCAAATRPV